MKRLSPHLLMGWIKQVEEGTMMTTYRVLPADLFHIRCCCFLIRLIDGRIPVEEVITRWGGSD